MKLSLIVPCYNEAKNIPLILEKFASVIKRQDIEVLLVNNGSTDNSQEIINQQLLIYSFVSLVHVNQNQGYGHGVLEGLKKASGDILSWTHADMQTDPGDVIKALELFHNTKDPENTFVKGKRYGRPFVDTFFTIGMSFFEIILLKAPMWDINAQPNLFHKSFLKTWVDPPKDFSLDLYVYFLAIKRGLTIKRFSVFFGERNYGVSSWNVSPSAKFRFIKRTLD